MFQFKETRLVVVFCTFKERHRAGAAADKTGLGVDAELVACIDDVEVAHGQLADTVGSCEHGVAFSIVRRSGSYVRLGERVSRIV